MPITSLPALAHQLPIRHSMYSQCPSSRLAMCGHAESGRASLSHPALAMATGEKKAKA